VVQKHRPSFAGKTLREAVKSAPAFLKQSQVTEKYFRSKPERRGLATLFCDVSFCPETKGAGFGAWVRFDSLEKGVLFGGEIPVRCKSSNDAEFWGLALALREIAKRFPDQSPAAIVLQCDNLAALEWVERFHPNAQEVGEHHKTKPLRNGPASYPKSMELAVQAVMGMPAEAKVWLKHVKGHTGKRDGRSWANRQCDNVAKEFMLKMRMKFQRENRAEQMRASSTSSATPRPR
jgi:ribonuclease HI